KLKLEMITPYGEILATEVDDVVAPGVMGEFGVLPGHRSMLALLQVGEFSYLQKGKRNFVAVNWGYVDVHQDRVTVMVETAEPADLIDLERARRAMGRAEEALKKLSDEDKEYKLMEAALARALIRIQVAGRRGR
ncbi:MAG: F0F1 ATP synthase subunit epsilon, partial [Deltaproteobacteria bacterium]|nr:F0F1 ATP synthase subunit epsilon [Deltaproteobacteria bacterium]